MRLLAALTTGLGVALGVAQADAATTPAQVWQGTAFITAVTPACVNEAAVGDDYVIEYRPIITGSTTNPATSNEGISFFGSRNGLHYSTAVGTSFRTSSSASILALGSRASSSSGTGTYALTIGPAAIVASTPTVTINGQLNDFWNTTGCSVRISAALARRNN